MCREDTYPISIDNVESAPRKGSSMIYYGVRKNRVVCLLVVISILGMWLGVNTHAFGCSNVFVAYTNSLGETHAAVARTMDLWLMSDDFGYGLVGDENTSNINMPQSGPVNAAKWVNTYGFLGQAALKTYILNDGVNTEGLYAGILELPGFTKYPEYNPEDTRPELGVLEIVTYALGTAKDVPDLIDVDTRTGKLLDVQPVINAGEVKGLFKSFPGHLVFRDKKGNSAVVEWIEGRTHFYVHKAGTREVVEIIDGKPHYRKVYEHVTGAVVTNAPPYGWHLLSEARLGYKSLFNGNTDRLWGGEHMNGSGLYGCAGDFTPVSRYLRATTLARLYPKPNTQPEAMSAAYSILQSIIVPLGANPQPSAWVTWVDLENSIYNFKPLNDAVTVGNGSVRYMPVKLVEKNLYDWQSYDVKKIVGGQEQPPADWIHAKVQPGATVTNPREIRKSIKQPTDGNFKQDVLFIE